jgi:ferredoxin
MLNKLFGGGSKPATVTVLPSNTSFTVDAKKTILLAALDQNIKYPHYCRVGSCSTCKTKLISGQVRELTDKSYTLSAEDIAAGYILACQSVPKTDLVLENPRLRVRVKEDQGALPPETPA